MRLTATKTLILLAAAAVFAPGQTQVDLRTQSKSIDFSAASSTKPFASGSALPATCGVGQMFFLTNTIGGQNMYGCSAVNTWTLQSGGPTSPTTVENAGTIVGTRPILNLNGGQGVFWSLSDTGTAISAQTMLDSALVQTRAGDQSGSNLLCASVSTGSSGVAYRCNMTPTLAAYSTGMVVHWLPDATVVGLAATTLNIDSLGAVAVEKADGITNPGASDVVAGQLYQLWYDGSVFRIASGGSSGSGSVGPAGPAGPAATHGLAFSIGQPGGSQLTTASISPTLGLPFACTIGNPSGSKYTLALGEGDSGTVTVAFWKVSGGTAIPTSANSISTSGLTLSSGSQLQSSTFSDFTTTTINQNDIMTMAIVAISGSVSSVTAVLPCQ